MLAHKIGIRSANPFAGVCGALNHLEEHHRTFPAGILFSESQGVVVATAIPSHRPVTIGLVLVRMMHNQEVLNAFQEAVQDGVLNQHPIVLREHLKVGGRPAPTEKLAEPEDAWQVRFPTDDSVLVAVVLHDMP